MSYRVEDDLNIEWEEWEEGTGPPRRELRGFYVRECGHVCFDSGSYLIRLLPGSCPKCMHPKGIIEKHGCRYCKQRLQMEEQGK